MSGLVPTILLILAFLTLVLVVRLAGGNLHRAAQQRDSQGFDGRDKLAE